MSCEELMEFINENNTFSKYLGIRTTELRIGYAKGEMPITKEYGNVIGSVHGGCLFTFADTIVGSAAASHGSLVTTISGEFHYLNPAIGVNKLICEAREIKYGKKILVYDAEVMDEQGKLIAKGTFSYFNLGKRIEEKINEK